MREGQDKELGSVNGLIRIFTGLLLVILGLAGVIAYWDELLVLIKIAVAISLILAGIVSIAAGRQSRASSD